MNILSKVPNKAKGLSPIKDLAPYKQYRLSHFFDMKKHERITDIKGLESKHTICFVSKLNGLGEKWIRLPMHMKRFIAKRQVMPLFLVLRTEDSPARLTKSTPAKYYDPKTFDLSIEFKIALHVIGEKQRIQAKELKLQEEQEKKEALARKIEEDKQLIQDYKDHAHCHAMQKMRPSAGDRKCLNEIDELYQLALPSDIIAIIRGYVGRRTLQIMYQVRRPIINMRIQREKDIHYIRSVFAYSDGVPYTRREDWEHILRISHKIWATNYKCERCDIRYHTTNQWNSTRLRLRYMRYSNTELTCYDCWDK